MHDPVAILGKRFGEIRKIVISRHSAMLYVLQGRGVDLEDALSEVYLGLLGRARGTSGWNPERTTFAYYVGLVSKSVLLNKIRQASNPNRPQLDMRVEFADGLGDSNDPESYVLLEEWATKSGDDAEVYLQEKLQGLTQRQSQLSSMRRQGARRSLGLVQPRAKRKSPGDHSPGLRSSIAS